ncbi:hypothetical protein [Rhizobium sp. CRRU65]|uniref:hypothetical protein n=1 Tax=Rhizobium sp. CRRU65 TaxID=3399566 RepID=UPI003AF5AB50
MPFNVCAAQKFVEGFGRTDDSLCVLSEQIEEAIFPRHEFSKPVQHLRSIDCHKAVIEHAVGREKPLATDVTGTSTGSCVPSKADAARIIDWPLLPGNGLYDRRASWCHQMFI